jgi:hypothetical protein
LRVREPECEPVDTSNTNRAGSEQNVAAPAFLGELDRRGADAFHTRTDLQQIVQAGGCAVVHSGAAHHEDGAGRVGQRLLIDPERTQPFGAGALKEFQIVGVEHHAARVGIFPIHTQVPVKRRHPAILPRRK